MGNDLRYMLIKVMMYDCIIGIIITLVMTVVSKSYILPAVIGLILASVNFVIGGIATNRVLLRKTNLVMLPYVIKTVLVCGVGVIIFIHNRYDGIAYIVGFISHFAALVAYGISIKDS